MRSVLTFVFLLLMAVLMVIYTVTCTVLFLITAPFDRDRRAMLWISYVISWSIVRLNPLWKVRVVGAEKLKGCGPLVVVANHQSMLDILTLYYAVRRIGNFVAKREVYRIPFFGWMLWARGDIAIERGTGAYRDVLSRGAELLSRGLTVYIFPEGGRTETGELGRYRTTAFLLARQAGASVAVCSMEGLYRSFDSRGFFRRTITVDIVEVVPPEKVAAEGELALSQRAQMMTKRSLEEARALRMAENN